MPANSCLSSRLALSVVGAAVLLSASNAIAGGCAPAYADYFRSNPHAEDNAAEDNATYVRLCRSLAEQGDAEAQLDLGTVYEFGMLVPGDYAEALKWYRKSGDGGYVAAQVHLGDWYDQGLYVPKDYAEAAKWWRKAAENGARNVQADLGFLYEQGKDYAEAAEWYRESAEQGHRHGQFGLGRLYADGNGVPQDYVLAHMWLNLAAAHGLEDAKSARDKLVSEMTPGQIAEAQRLAREWKPTK